MSFETVGRAGIGSAVAGLCVRDGLKPGAGARASEVACACLPGSGILAGEVGWACGTACVAVAPAAFPELRGGAALTGWLAVPEGDGVAAGAVRGAGVAGGGACAGEAVDAGVEAGAGAGAGVADAVGAGVGDALGDGRGARGKAMPSVTGP